MVAEYLFFLAISVLSLRDIRSYVAPGAWLLGMGGLILGLYVNPFRTLIISALVLWVLLEGRPAWLLLFLLHPVTFLLTPIAYGVLADQVGIGDLLVLVSIAALFPWFALLFAVLGMQLWMDWWKLAYRSGPVPLLPGIGFGFGLWLVLLASVT